MKHVLCSLMILMLLVFPASLCTPAEADDAAIDLSRLDQMASALMQSAEASEPEPANQAEIARRGLEAIQATGWADTIILPQEESYLAEWKVGYARKAFQAPCLRVERISELQTGRLTMPYLYEGVRTITVAEENDMSCILYRGNDNELYAGWIQSIRLLEEFPGMCYTIGTQTDRPVRVLDDIPVHWSLRSFLGSQQNYTVLSEPVPDCVGFTLEYQLISENTPDWDLILGPRKIYVKSGEEWFEAGEFPYQEFGAVRVEVFLPEPMTVEAVGTIAQCPDPEIFYFRQTVYDVLQLSD